MARDRPVCRYHQGSLPKPGLVTFLSLLHLESDLIPYSACQGVPAQAALVLAPHPDDEIFGCGGAIARHVQAGVPVQVVVLTDGAVFGNTTLRRQECRAAAKMLGYGEPDFWHFPDRGLLYSEALVQRVLEKIIDGDTDLVYAPSPWELHPDHRQTASVAIEAVRRATKPVRLAFYEVGAPLRPNLLLDITPFVSIKEAAMKCFGSQLTQQDYLRHIRALNQFRTYTLPREVLAAEAFWLLSPGELVQVMEAGLLTLVSPGLSTERVDSPRRLPQVTIMIRSMGRESLQEALDSVALQTYPNIKVVVVAATTNHPPLPQTCGPFALQLLETPLPLSRSQAANKALAHASGDFLLFLDDDDWLMPEHIARLAHVLSHQPHALAAYSGISLVDATGQPLGQTFDLPYDAIRQAAGNLTPIHAVLFSAKVIEKGCRFDETIELYEDWDFWLQLAKITTMVHVPGVTGAYRIHESSGVHVSSGPSGEAAEVIYRKWASEWTPAQVGQMMLRVWSHQEMEESLAQAREQLLKTKAELGSLVQSIKPVDLDNAHLVSTVNDLSRQLEQEKQDRQLLLQSRSWRFTRPMRWVANMMRTSPIGWSVRKIREFRINGFNMNLAALDLYRKACAYSNKYGFRALLTRSCVEIVKKAEQTSSVLQFIQPLRSIPSLSQLTQSRFDALTPLPTYLLSGFHQRRISVVTDSIARGSLFGGVGTALILTTLLANKLGANLRIITRTEPPRAENVHHILSVYGLELKGELQLDFSPVHDQKHNIDFSENEMFVTTSWWTTAATLGGIPAKSVVYLLQEDERMFYPYGDDRLRCEEILRKNDIRFLINTKLLFDHLVTDGLVNIKEKGIWFEPSFPREVFRPQTKPANTKYRFAFYARPNNLRNLFYLGIQVINSAIQQQILNLDQWEIIFVGKDIPDVTIDDGKEPIKYQNLNWSEYAQLVGTVDLGLSLMCTPHPSYPPLDLAASGAVVVTNRFSNKQDLNCYSANLICADPELHALVDAIRKGIALATDPVAREQNFINNKLSTDWNQSLKDVIQVLSTNY